MKTYRDVGRAAFGQFGVWIVQFQVQFRNFLVWLSANHDEQVVFLELAFCAGFIIVALENLEELLPDADRLVMCAIALPILVRPAVIPSRTVAAVDYTKPLPCIVIPFSACTAVDCTTTTRPCFRPLLTARQTRHQRSIPPS